MGRPPIFKVAMTNAERVRRYRIKRPIKKGKYKNGILRGIQDALDTEARNKVLINMVRELKWW